jgi:hypothetical protein
MCKWQKKCHAFFAITAAQKLRQIKISAQTAADIFRLYVVQNAGFPVMRLRLKTVVLPAVILLIQSLHPLLHVQKNEKPKAYFHLIFYT